MKDPKSNVRYVGYRTLQGGGRGFDFSVTDSGIDPNLIMIDAASCFFHGPDRIAIQEAAGICYETLKCRIQTDPALVSGRFDLTATDVAQHRKSNKPHGNRH